MLLPTIEPRPTIFSKLKDILSQDRVQQVIESEDPKSEARQLASNLAKTLAPNKTSGNNRELEFSVGFITEFLKAIQAELRIPAFGFEKKAKRHILHDLRQTPTLKAIFEVK